MSSIISKETQSKGNGGHAGNFERRSKVVLSGCFKHPEGCDSCKLPPEKCSGNVRPGKSV